MIEYVLQLFGHVPSLAGGLFPALQLTLLSLLIGYPLGLVFASLSASRQLPVRVATIALVELGRGFPLLVLLLLVYRGFPQAGFRPGPMASAVAAFAFSAAAYSTEMLRSSVAAVPAGQREVATAIGMRDIDAFRYIVFPQAIRIALPPLMSLAIQMFQLTSLAYLVTVSEVMQRAKSTSAETFETLQVFIVAACIYASVTVPASFFVRKLEKRLSKGRR